jgi:hypothetical protein
MQTPDKPTISSEQVKVRQQVRQSKDQLTYWRSKLRRVAHSPYWYIELQRRKVRHRISLETANRDAAAYLARDIWRYVQTHGWASYFEKYRPTSVRPTDLTLGIYIAAVERTCTIRPKTLRGYIGALRKIAGDISNLADCPSKYGSGGGYQAWLERIHALKLSMLSPAAIQEWKRSFLARASQDPISQRSARVSVNSFLRSARGLFSPGVIEHLGLELTGPVPFASTEYEPKNSTKYRSSFDIHALVESARELGDTDPEGYKIFLLAAFAGLRKREIDLLEWPAFHWNRGVVSITPTQHFSAKSEDSYNDVAIDRELIELFRNYSARATSSFVIESARPPRPAASYDYYRCGEIFDRVIQWLRAHGVQTLKPLHTLRKEFGSMICANAGIHAASRALRHSAVAVTDQFYSDSRVRATVGLGHLLEPSRIVEFKQSEIA